MALLVHEDRYEITLKNLRRLWGGKNGGLNVDFRQSQTDRDLDPERFPNQEKIVGLFLTFIDEEIMTVLNAMMTESVVAYWGVMGWDNEGLIWETNPILHPPKRGSFEEQSTSQYRPIYPTDFHNISGE